MSPMQYVALILAGGTAVPTGVVLLARHLVESHADRTAAAIRRQYGEPESRCPNGLHEVDSSTCQAACKPAPAARRPKELTR